MDILRVMRRLAPVLLLAALTACSGVSSGGQKAGAAHTVASHSSVPDTPAPTPNPDVRFTHSCDYLLGDFSGNGYRFIARATLRNQGNVGTRVLVKASWVQVGSPDVTRSKVVRVPYRRSLPVNFSVPVSGSQVDQIQSAQDAGSICHVSARVVDTFGNPRGPHTAKSPATLP